MKKILFLVLLNCLAIVVYGQTDFEKYTICFPADANTQPIGLIAALPDNGFSIIGLRMKDAYPNQRDTTFEAQLNRGNVIERIDSGEAHFYVRGIYTKNAPDYEFRVMENKGKTLVNWQTIYQFADNNVQIRDLPKGMGYLGAYQTAWNNYLIVDIRKKGTAKNVASMVMYWRQIKPVLLNIYTNDELSQFLAQMKQSYPLGLDEDERKGWAAKYAPDEIDKSTFLPKKLLLEADERSVIFLLNASTFPKAGLEYKLLKNDEVLEDWKANENFNNYIWLKNLEQGEYRLMMRFAIQRHNVTEYPFKIKQKWYQRGFAQWILGCFGGLIILLLMSLRQKKKLKKQQQQNEKIGQELKAIRSQLNPHFVFNALSSIQGLMNKNDLTNANYYLTKFSALLRDSLANNEKEYVPLSIELKTLETYIKLEQLRFPFTYSFHIDERLDAHAIEIPYLLLQPLIENAIKHGVSSLYEKGVLTLLIYPKKNDLIIEIKDNGKGFNIETETIGYGLKLTKERVRLLSESNIEQPVNLLIESNKPQGITAYLTLRNWI